MTSRRSIQTVLFTDIVDSTVRAAELGDRRWKELLNEHHDRVRRQVRRFGGREVKDLGDGFLIVFDRPADAIRCAAAIRRKVGELDLDVTAGIHTGAIEDDGSDIGGIAVHIASRIHALAAPGEILVSHVTSVLESGSGFAFEDRGDHDLKGVPDIWRLLALAADSVESEAVVPAAPEEPSRRSIAVLPFENLSRTADAEPFVAGLHDDLLTQLSKISALTVISRTSVTGYRNSARTLPEIARELGVGTLVEGGVQQAGERIRLNVKLFDVRRDAQLWAESYDRRLSTENIFDIQSELATQIVQRLEAKLTPQEKRRMRREPTANLDAYRLYVRGRIHLDKRTEQGMRRALDTFRRAIEEDEGYALAWAGLADALNLLEFYGYDAPNDDLDARRAAERAAELDPELGEARTALGILYVQRRQAPAAIRELARAVELAPSNADAHVWRGWMELIVGRPRQALAPVERGLELDPLAPAVKAYAVEVYLANDAVDEALRQARRAVEIQPTWSLARYMLGLSLVHRREYAEAEAALREAAALTSERGLPSSSLVHAALAVTLVARGDDSGARRLVSRIEAADDPFSEGLVHAALGEGDEAFAAWERAKRWNPVVVEHLRYFFPEVLGPLRNDPRYGRILREMERSWGVE